MMQQFRIILASGSPQRKALLSAAGYEFEVIAPPESIENGICSQCGPAELVLDLAARKAAFVASQFVGIDHEPLLVIACDTVAECGGTILGKPRDEDHARAMIEHLRGKRHRVYSGLCLWRLFPHEKRAPKTRIAMTELEMKYLNDAEIDDYLATGLWREKAGAFGLQDRPDWLRVIAGSETNVVGLPTELLFEMISDP